MSVTPLKYHSRKNINDIFSGPTINVPPLRRDPIHPKKGKNFIIKYQKLPIIVPIVAIKRLNIPMTKNHRLTKTRSPSIPKTRNNCLPLDMLPVHNRGKQ